MKPHGMRASNIVGHHEIFLDNSDTGKHLMAQIRCLLVANALTECSLEMNQLVFGQYLISGHEPIQAVLVCLRWVRDYLAMVSQPGRVSPREEESRY
jgi:hypothetical protein